MSHTPGERKLILRIKEVESKLRKKSIDNHVMKTLLRKIQLRKGTDVDICNQIKEILDG